MNISSYEKAFLGISKMEDDEIYSNLKRIDDKIESRRALKSQEL